MTTNSANDMDFRAKGKHKHLWAHLSSATLEISLGNKWQDQPYLAAQLNWVSKNFDHCYISLGDTLHRHNLLNRLEPEDAHLASYIMGSAWLARNADTLNQLQIPYDVIRWDHWLQHPDFPALHDAMRAYYDSNAFFRKIVQRDVALFLERNPQADPARCVDYLLEEAAADTLFARQTPTARLYPASELATYAHLSRTQVPLEIMGLNRSVHVRVSFHRRRDGGALSAPETPHKRIEVSEEMGFSDRSGALPTAE